MVLVQPTQKIHQSLEWWVVSGAWSWCTKKINYYQFKIIQHPQINLNQFKQISTTSGRFTRGSNPIGPHNFTHNLFPVPWPKARGKLYLSPSKRVASNINHGRDQCEARSQFNWGVKRCYGYSPITPFLYCRLHFSINNSFFMNRSKSVLVRRQCQIK